jgi:hypothetical protein
MIKIIAGSLFRVENSAIILDRVNEELEKFINYPFRDGSLKYDVQNKLGKAVIKEIAGINEFRIKLSEELHVGTESDEISKRLFDLLGSEIELECSPVSLSKLLSEDCSGFNFNVLDRFIADDRE